MSKPTERFLRDLTWDEKAAENPLYAVMSRPEFSGSTEPTTKELERFFADGAVKAATFLQPWLKEHGATDGCSILEYGCGMGRLLKALTGHGYTLAGVDISPRMAELAQTFLGNKAAARALSAEGSIPFPDEYCDFAYSYAVFQHIRRTSDLWKAIGEIARVMRSGAHFKFQFDMLYPIDAISGRYAFETSSVTAGPAKRLPIPSVRLHKHNHWGGCRPGYTQLKRHFAAHHLILDGITCEAANMVWITGRKAGA